MGRYILSLDQGTTSSRAVLYNEKAEICGIEQIEYKQIFTGNGWVEHDPEDILNSQIQAAGNVIKNTGTDPESIAAIGITNQRETTIIWDKNTGKPVYNAVVWQCRRTADICEGYKNQGLEKFFRIKQDF